MAIPGTPQSFYVQAANQVVLVSWNLSAGSTAYIVQRSLDNVTFATIANIVGSPLANQYVDKTATLGVNYFYQVAASSRIHALALDTGLVYYSNGVTWNLVSFPNQITGVTSYATFSAFPAASTYTGTGVSPYTTPASIITAPTGEMTLADIRLAAQQRADRVNSNSVSPPEWRGYINKAMAELNDMLITSYENYNIAPPVQFVCDGTTYLYPLPNGTNTFLNANNLSQTLVPPAAYKITGVDLSLQNVSNGYVTVNRFNFIDRNNYVYPNTSSTLYGVFNMQYDIQGNNIMFTPTPSAGQGIRLWYIPRMTELLLDTDTTTQGINGWIEYVIVRAAIYALTKEESPTDKLEGQLQFLKGRIEEAAQNRDAGQPMSISNTARVNGGYGSGGFNGYGGGY